MRESSFQHRRPENLLARLWPGKITPQKRTTLGGLPDPSFRFALDGEYLKFPTPSRCVSCPSLSPGVVLSYFLRITDKTSKRNQEIETQASIATMVFFLI